jgi:SpoVK/Ycf46/Vps4 family AAA+-type ATPase
VNRENFTNEIEYLIRARYSLIYVYTFEEERAFKIISGISQKLNKRIITWTATKGLELEGKSLEPKSIDFKAALNLAGELAKEPSIFVWFDAHSFLKPSSSPVFIRELREFSQNLRTGLHSNSIIVSPSMDIPVELKKEITILDLPLPDLDEVKKIIMGFISQFVDRQDIYIDQSNSTIESLARASVGLSQAEIENCLAKSLVRNRRITNDEVKLILEEKKQIIRKSGILEYVSTEKLDLGQIGGLENLKRWLERRKATYYPEARDFGLDWPKGVLLVGVPGCGKSLCAKCIATTWQMPLLRLDLGRVFAGVVGSSEANMRTALNLCETVSPSIVWIDEIEKALAGAGNGASDAGTATRVFGTLLTWMQEKKSPVFVFATANNIHSLPPELLRKGRFDEIFFVDLPNEVERGEIFKIHISKLARPVEKFQINKLVEVSGETFWGEDIRLTGSEIEAAIKEGLLDAYTQKVNEKMAERDLSTEDIVRAIQRTVPLAKVRKNEMSVLREWAKENAVRASLVSSSEKQQFVETTVGRNIDF